MQLRQALFATKVAPLVKNSAIVAKEAEGSQDVDAGARWGRSYRSSDHVPPYILQNEL